MQTRLLISLPILLLGIGLRFHALAQDARFHPDEALFATFARAAAVKGDWLLHGSLDKTPLSIYAMAVSMMFAGVTADAAGVLHLDIQTGEFAARLPNTLAGIVMIPLMYALAMRLCTGQRTQKMVSATAMLLMALSPFAIAFSATAFTDGLMLLWMTLALWMAARGKPGWSGIFLALSFASKQQAMFYLPLVLWLLVYAKAAHRLAPHRGLMRFIAPLLVCLAVLLLWDAARAQPSGLFALASANNNPERLFVRSDELLPRLAIWLEYSGALLGPAWLTALLSLLALVGVVAKRPRSRVNVALPVYAVGYLLLHWLVAFNTYDRYLLPVLPVLIALAAWGMVYWGEKLTQRRRATEAQKGNGLIRARGLSPLFKNIRPVPLMTVAVGVIMFLPAWNASEGRVAVGGDLGKHEGIDQLAEYLNEKPVAAVIYDRWLGWELGYYLGVWTNKRLTYYPTAALMVSGALSLPESGPRYFPVPKERDFSLWRAAFKQARFAVSPVYETARFIVFELMPPAGERGASASESSWPGQALSGDD